MLGVDSADPLPTEQQLVLIHHQRPGQVTDYFTFRLGKLGATGLLDVLIINLEFSLHFYIARATCSANFELYQAAVPGGLGSRPAQSLSLLQFICVV